MDVARAVSRLAGHAGRILVSEVNNETVGAASGLLRVRRREIGELRGHFPGRPVLPGVLLLEAMFQIAATRLADGAGFVDVQRVTEARFRRPVYDGDDVLIRVQIVKGNEELQRGGKAVMFRGLAELANRGEDKGAAVGDATFLSFLSK
jgi:3-hydroxymyristoyl/3-hydroxydecanoyl-(acyl carrier protein) dehydratase